MSFVPIALKAEVEPFPIYYPTVLVALDDDGLENPVATCLRNEGFHVLQADDWAHVLPLCREHSRRIHLLVTDQSVTDFVPLLKLYRPHL